MDNNNTLGIHTPQDDRIMAYFRGEMDQAQEAAFLASVRQDETLRQNVVAIARIAKGMKGMGRMMDDEVKRALLATSPSSLVELLERVDGKEAAKLWLLADQIHCCMSQPEDICASIALDELEPKPSRWGKRLAYVASVAASVVLLVFGGLKYKSYSDTTALGAQYANVYYQLSPERGGDKAKVEKELRLLLSYSTDRKEAVKRLGLLWELSRMDVYNDYTDYSQEIGWSLAIACLMDNDKAQAKQVLEKLASIAGGDSAFGKKVLDLLEKVNEL